MGGLEVRRVDIDRTRGTVVNEHDPSPERNATRTDPPTSALRAEPIPRSTDQFRQDFGAGLRLLVVAGIPVGVVVVGVGSRLAMLVLRLTSPDSVRGVKSDDGFIIGRFTVAGTYNLLNLGATVGVVGAAAYLWVRPWLLGPVWFRRFTVGAAAAAVVGSMLVHADGIDFNVLTPAWLAIGLFVVLPGLFALAITIAVDWVGRVDWLRVSRRRMVPAVIVMVLLFPFVLPIVLLSSLVLAAWLLIRSVPTVALARTSVPYRLIISALWLVAACAGLVALVNDVTEIA